uniref:Peptidase M14 domain-containing protein n=2 Tax=Timema TaxID=61471 RepID=A0A7R9FXT3_TIMSH|nr:unnamed protein product [Timema shepardi]CAD7570359.1 unnamed protein product [Timema californicum]
MGVSTMRSKGSKMPEAEGKEIKNKGKEGTAQIIKPVLMGASIIFCTMQRLTPTVPLLAALLRMLSASALEDGDTEETVVSYKGYQLIRVFPMDGPQVDLVRSLVDKEEQVTLWSRHFAPSRGVDTYRRNQSSAADLLTSPRVKGTVVDYLDTHHIAHLVLIQDLQTAIESENPPMEPEDEEWENRGGHRLSWTRYHRHKGLHKYEDSRANPVETTVSRCTPSAFTFFIVSDIDSYLDYLANTYTDICQTEIIGKSSQGRDLKLLKVSTGGKGKPAIWIDGGMTQIVYFSLVTTTPSSLSLRIIQCLSTTSIHAREWISPATVTYILLHLVEFRDQHSELLDSVDWYILPLANPDGYEYSHSTDRLWRKTRSRVGGSRRGAGCYGVDPNRNWDFHWAPGSPSDSCREDFSGPRAFSEPETRAMSEFILSRQVEIKVYLTVHSYSQMWLVPWGYKEEKPRDYYDMYTLAEKGVEALEAIRGTDYLLGTAAELLYTAPGGSDDWAKGVAGIKYSYSIELPDTGDYGFVLPANQIEPVGQETWAAVKAIATHFADGHN